MTDPTSVSAPLLSVRDLGVQFDTLSGPLQAVRGVSFDVAAGETVAVVGESGSGKSTLASAINRLLAANGRIVAGSVALRGRELTTLAEREMRSLRGADISLVPQDPMSNLDPVQTIGSQVLEALEVHGRGHGEQGRRRAVELLDAVGIPDPAGRFGQYPHEFSGGMRQRVLIAMALACEPALLIADEPTSALDVTVQRIVLDQLGELTQRLGTAVILITHDLALAAERADRVLVMYHGEVVETGAAEEILHNPGHEYAKRLVAAVPSLITTPMVPPASAEERPETIARLEGVGHRYRIRGSRTDEFWAARDVSFEIPRGRTVSIVGESGSGKTTTARMLLGLENPTEGRIVIGDRDLAALNRAETFRMRRRVQPVFQNPYASLDPRYTIERAIAEPLRVHHIGDAKSQAERVASLLDQVALPPDVAQRFPHELSGGQQQRVAIARALALEPDLVVLDEAVSALDVLVQSQILELLVGLQERLGLSYLFISHDLAVVRMISHEVHVMQQGVIVESGTPDKIFAAPEQDYTRELIAAIPGHHRVAYRVG